MAFPPRAELSAIVRTRRRRAATPERAFDSRRAEAARPPRLVLRFAVYTAVGLGIAAACILLFVRHQATSQAEGAVAFHAQFVSDAVLHQTLRPSDLAAPVDAPRRKTLDALFRRDVLVGSTVRALLVNSRGVVTYATDQRLIGSDRSDAYGKDGLTHAPTTKVTSIDLAERANTKVLEAFAPVDVEDASGVLELDQDYAPVARQARSAFLPVVAALELVLVALYVALFPVFRRIARRLETHVREVEHLALHDSLTGLANRALFADRVEQSLRAARRGGSSFAVMLIDLDGFKEVNDTLGHASGDRLLIEFGARLETALREADTIARLGGDEFAILAPNARDSASALFLAQRVTRELERPFVLGDLRIELEASIGIAMRRDDEADAGMLLRQADVAMYASKLSHRPCVYEESLDHHSEFRLSLVAQLRRALAERELEVHYQPQIECASGAVRRVEALVRWRHPDRGLLRPAVFIPLAEQSGLIRPLTQFVLEEAVRQCAAWEGQGIGIDVAVNISGRDLTDPSFPEQIRALLTKWDVKPSRLQIEVTESMLPRDLSQASAVLQRLSSEQITIALDDFGSGESSLSHLRELPVNTLKIDNTFVSDIADGGRGEALVRSIIRLGQSLGLEVVAEGVETDEMEELLATLGCDTAQGMHVCPARSGEKLTPWLRAKKPSRAHAPKRRQDRRLAAAATR